MQSRNDKQVIIYGSGSAKQPIDVRVEKDTIWLTQKQIAELFDIDRSVITKHIKNIFNIAELKEKSNVQFLHIANSDKPVAYYNLDVIISVGYRVNSRRATQFRIWATQILKEYLTQGFVLSERRLKAKRFEKIRELEQATALLQQTIERHEVNSDEARGLLKVIADYTQSWILLQQYDHDAIQVKKVRKKIIYNLTHDDATQAIGELGKRLRSMKEAGDLFGQERDHMLAAILGNLNQTFGRAELYASLEAKAAHLLYFIIKDHVFSDGNKRLASFLFIVFLARNKHLYNKKGEKKINDSALVALALLIAESDPKQKDTMIKLIINLINK